MRPEESFVSNPIRSLQTMLRVAAAAEGRNTSVIPDGFYGRQTMNEVMGFQRRNGLPVTGITDQRTWEAIVKAHDDGLPLVDAAEAVEVILNPGQVIRKGEAHPIVFIAQGMLHILSDAYGSICQPSHSGRLDLPTAESLGSFQSLSGLGATGELDRKTWKHLARHYPLAANLLLPDRECG